MLYRNNSHHLTLGTFGPPFLRIPVGLPVADLTSHVHITGTTNSGKSGLLAHLAVSLIERGEGVTLIDPHGDAARLVLAHLVNRGVYDDARAYERITYLDLPAAARVWRYTPLNILAQSFAIPRRPRGSSWRHSGGPGRHWRTGSRRHSRTRSSPGSVS
jgi:DNA helicase HerA-like ATPase